MRVSFGLLLLLFLSSPTNGESRVGGEISPDGTEIQLDLPKRFHIKNKGGSDGSGCCVFASLCHSAIWQKIESHEGLFDYAVKRPGGGWPDKLQKYVNDIAKEKGVPPPILEQYEGTDPDVIRQALSKGYMPGVTYSHSPTGRYRGARISHMVSCVHFDEKWVGILDNNFPGSIEWMDPTTFKSVWTGGRGNGWAAFFVSPGPPPIPRNK